MRKYYWSVRANPSEKVWDFTRPWHIQRSSYHVEIYTMLPLRSRALPFSSSCLKPVVSLNSAIPSITRSVPVPVPEHIELEPVLTNQPRPYSTPTTTIPIRTYSSALSRPQSPFSASLSPSASRRPSALQSQPPSERLPSQSRSFSATAFLSAKRRTYNPSRKVQKRRHGFLARLRTRGGRKVLANRRLKGRKALTW